MLILVVPSNRFGLREQQDFLQRPPERHLLLRFAVWDHVSAPLCTQPYTWPLLSDSLQPCLSDIPAEVNLYLLQTRSMSRHSLQAGVGDADAVFQVEAAQLPAALQHRGQVLVSDVSTAGEGQGKQVWTPEAQKVDGYMISHWHVLESNMFETCPVSSRVITPQDVMYHGGISLFENGLVLSKQCCVACVLTLTSLFSFLKRIR